MSSSKEKKSQPKKTEKKEENSYKTKPNLSSGYCDTTFKNALRNADPNSAHGETLMVNPNIKKSVRQNRQQISHVFSNDNILDEKPKLHRKINYVPDNVMFNDDYVEKNPKINREKKLRYLKEKEWKSNDKNLYSDELNIGKERQKVLERKINENYKTNPMQILTDEQNKNMNKIQREKNINHTRAYNKILGSGELGNTFDGMKIYGNDNDGVGGKITKNNFNINDEAKNINKNDLPNFGRKRFNVASYGSGVFGYM